MSGGAKHDEGKPRMDLVPHLAFKEVAKVMGFGSAKYDSYDWRKGLEYGRLYGAALRHMNAFWDGEDLDKESGLPHLAHATCCLMMLYETSASEVSDNFDNRPPKIGDNCNE